MISASIVPVLSGVDNYRYLINDIVGNSCVGQIRVDEGYKDRCAILHFFDSDGKEGIVKEIRGEECLQNNRKVLDYCLACKVGGRVMRAEDDSRRIGYYIAYADSRKELDDLIEEIDRSFEIEIEE